MLWNESVRSKSASTEGYRTYVDKQLRITNEAFFSLFFSQQMVE